MTFLQNPKTRTCNCVDLKRKGDGICTSRGKGHSSEPSGKNNRPKSRGLALPWLDQHPGTESGQTVTFPEGNDSQGWNITEEKAEQHWHSCISLLPDAHENLGNGLEPEAVKLHFPHVAANPCLLRYLLAARELLGMCFLCSPNSTRCICCSKAQFSTTPRSRP